MHWRGNFGTYSVFDLLSLMSTFSSLPLERGPFDEEEMEEVRCICRSGGLTWLELT